MKFLFYAAVGMALAACSPSKEKIDAASTLCESFVKGQIASATSTKIFDVWEKHGAIVVEVGYQRNFPTGQAYTIRKCVYNEKDSTLTMPAQIDRQWDKH